MKNDNGVNAKLQTINQVEGFDPAAFAVEYTDLNTKEKRLRLPVMTQMGWFRLVHPKGKISVTTHPGKDFFVAHARVYVSYDDPAENFLAEATASRSWDPKKPTVSPREWAQTAAIGIALRNAGFGLQMDAAGDGFDQLAVNEGMSDIQFTQGTGVPSIAPASATAPEMVAPATPAGNDVPFGVAQEYQTNDAAPAVPFQATAPSGPAMAEQPAESFSAPLGAPPAAPAAPVMPQPGQPVTTLEQALLLPCPIKDYAGKTLGDVLKLEPDAIVWIANKFTNDPAIAEGARLICEHAQYQASA